MKQLIYIILFLCFLAAPVGAAITPDATSSAVSAQTASSITWAHTVGSGCTNAILVVKVGWFTGSATTISSITYNSVSATVIDNETNPANTTRTALWRLVAPTLGSSQNIVVTMSGTTSELTATASSYCGVHQTTPLGTAAKGTDFTGTSTITVSSAVGEVVTDVTFVSLGGVNPTLTVGAGQTQRANIASVGTEQQLGSSDEPGASSVVMSWAVSPDVRWVAVGVPLKPAPDVRRRTRNVYP